MKLEAGQWKAYLGRGEEVFIVREGMTLTGLYRVLEIRPPTLTLLYLPPVSAALADNLGREPTEQQFADEIARWATLFWRLGQSVAIDLVGLVGELAVISCMDDPAFWIAAWHSSPGEVWILSSVDQVLRSK